MAPPPLVENTQLHARLVHCRAPHKRLQQFASEFALAAHLRLLGARRPGGGGSKPSKKKTKVAVSKRLRKATLEGTSERAPCGKGKGPAEATKSPDRAPTLRDLCEVDDWAGKDRYFVAQISELPRLVAEGPLKPRWPNLTNSTRVWTERPIAAEYVRGALHPSLAKQLYESPFEELMDQAAKSAVWVALERFRAKYLESSVEEDPFAERPKDANVRMEEC
ncbi:hypothetical protein BHE74_00040920 [Ensete ventricosum]|nr:hypothetical protein BHE74_00040920 [Ensete ventricosum]